MMLGRICHRLFTTLSATTTQPGAQHAAPASVRPGTRLTKYKFHLKFRPSMKSKVISPPKPRISREEIMRPERPDLDLLDDNKDGNESFDILERNHEDQPSPLLKRFLSTPGVGYANARRLIRIILDRDVLSQTQKFKDYIKTNPPKTRKRPYHPLVLFHMVSHWSTMARFDEVVFILKNFSVARGSGPLQCKTIFSAAIAESIRSARECGASSVVKELLKLRPNTPRPAPVDVDSIGGQTFQELMRLPDREIAAMIEKLLQHDKIDLAIHILSALIERNVKLTQTIGMAVERLFRLKRNDNVAFLIEYAISHNAKINAATVYHGIRVFSHAGNFEFAALLLKLLLEVRPEQDPLWYDLVLRPACVLGLPGEHTVKYVARLMNLNRVPHSSATDIYLGTSALLCGHDAAGFFRKSSHHASGAALAFVISGLVRQDKASTAQWIYRQTMDSTSFGRLSFQNEDQFINFYHAKISMFTTPSHKADIVESFTELVMGCSKEGWRAVRPTISILGSTLKQLFKLRAFSSIVDIWDISVKGFGVVPNLYCYTVLLIAYVNTRPRLVLDTAIECVSLATENKLHVDSKFASKMISIICESLSRKKDKSFHKEWLYKFDGSRIRPVSQYQLVVLQKALLRLKQPQ